MQGYLCKINCEQRGMSNISSLDVETKMRAVQPLTHTVRKFTFFILVISFSEN